MSSLRGRLRGWAMFLGASLLAGLAAVAALGMTMQFGAGVPTGPGALPGRDVPNLGPSHGEDQEPYINPEIQAKQKKRLREQHQQELFHDTDRMLQLAIALKAEVDKGDQANVAADLLKQADEIARLAKRVSDHIKTQ